MIGSQCSRPSWDLISGKTKMTNQRWSRWIRRRAGYKNASSRSLTLAKASFVDVRLQLCIPEQLESYIYECWEHYCSAKVADKFVFPYTTIVQSSGFGKSRLLRELAERTQTTDSRMKVLYVCVRQGRSSGYPVRTKQWPEYLFESVSEEKPDDKKLETDLSSRLLTVFHNVMLNWDSVGQSCLPHFLNRNESETYSKLTREDSTKEDKPVQYSSHKESRILVLALDEARWLLETDINDQTGWFRRFRRALNHANKAIRFMYGKYAGIFAILVDTNSKISKFTPPPIRDPSSREPQTGDSVLFPPFILTQTMDIILDAGISTATQVALEFYSKFVRMDTGRMRDGLVDMGRPLWQQYKVANAENEKMILSQSAREGSRNDEWEKLLDMAAEKLVGGQALRKVAEGDSSTLGGVGALLCRVGIRPYSWSSLASRMVADYMAVLAHMNFAHDQFVSTYSSDPILTFGAAKVWHENAKVKIGNSTLYENRSLLEYRILPELRTMLHQEVLDTGGIGELVERVVLLLAMDATGVVATDIKAERCYAGNFYSASTFLKVLSGESSEIINAQELSVDDLLKPWESWTVGFSHFVQLSEEPSDKLLWAMLARRVACALPLGFTGIDLLIPIFKDSEVSMILIQVKNCERDSSYPKSALDYTRPGHVFNGNLKNFKNEDVLRVYMSLRGSEPLQQYFKVDGMRGCRQSPRIAEQDSTPATNEQTENMTTSPNEPKKYAFALCLRGLNRWNASGNRVTVVSQSVADQLKPLLTPWKKLKTLVETDLELRGSRFGMESSVVMKIAVHPLVEIVLVDKWENVNSKSTHVPPLSEASDTYKQHMKSRKVTQQKRKGKNKLVGPNVDEDYDNEDSDNDNNDEPKNKRAKLSEKTGRSSSRVLQRRNGVNEARVAG